MCVVKGGYFIVLSSVNIRKYSFEEERRDLSFGLVGDQAQLEHTEVPHGLIA